MQPSERNVRKEKLRNRKTGDEALFSGIKKTSDQYS